MTRSLILAVLCALLLLAGCANPYSRFHTDRLDGKSVHEIPHLISHEGDAQIYKPLSLGVKVRDLSDDLRRKIGSNRGVVVNVVVKGSPASQADIMRGDIITRINYEVVSDVQGFRETIDRYAGQEIVLQTFREGQERRLELDLGPPAVGASGRER